MRAPSLPQLELPEPRALRRSIASIPAGWGTRTARPPEELRAEARRWLEQNSRQSQPQGAPRTMVGPLLALLEETDEPATCQWIVWSVLHAESTSWRRLWALWQLAGPYTEQVAGKLAQRLWDRLEHSARFKTRLPPWLAPASLLDLHDALVAPVPRVVGHYERNRIPLHEWPRETELTDSRGCGLDSVLTLIRRGHPEWWRCSLPDQARTWAESRKNRAIIAALADRQLCALGEGAVGPHQLQNMRGGRDLLTWVLARLGDPALRPGNWADVSKEARQVFEWLLLADSFQKILQEFRKAATDDARASYWERFFPRVRDALYYEARTSAVCLMIFGNLLVIEFGSTGNACYVYRWPSEAPPLRTLKLRKALTPGHFKSRSQLQLGTLRIPFLAKYGHQHGWQGKFDDFMVSLSG